MIQTNSRFRINEKLVTSKMIDGEAIIINLSNGMYYSLDKTGALVWLLVGASSSVGEAADLLSKRFSTPVAQVREDISNLVKDLVAQNLVVPADSTTAATKIVLDPPAGEPYVTPVLNTYDDMGDVLALDPPLPQVEIENEAWETSRS
jgi:hypothetical protein